MPAQLIKPNAGRFVWTKQRGEAAALLAEEKLTDAEITAKLGMTGRTLSGWKAVPEFQARIENIVEDFRKAVLRRGIAECVRRIASLDDRWKHLARVIEERAEDPAMAHVPGGKTGLLVPTLKASAGEFRTEYVVDTGVLAEMRMLEQRAAQEIAELTGLENQVADPEARFVVNIVGETRSESGNESRCDRVSVISDKKPTATDARVA